MIFSEHPKKQYYIWWLSIFWITLTLIVIFRNNQNTSGIDSYFPETTPFCSIFNKRQSGYSAFAELNKLIGIKVHAWELPYRRLNEIKGTLLVIAPSETPNDNDIEHILSWVATGNQLIYFDNFSFRFNRHLLHKLSINFTHAPNDIELTIKTLPKTQLFAHVPYLKLDSENRLVDGQSFVDDHFGSIITTVQHGRGVVLLGTAPGLCSNDKIADKDYWPNFQFFINYIRSTGQDIWFDERCHGFSVGNNVFFFLARSTFGLIFLQLFIIFAIALISLNQRFVRAQKLNTERIISSLEFVNNLAFTYKKARAAGLVWQILIHSYQTKMSRLLQLPPEETKLKILDCWEKLTGKQAAEFQKFLPDENTESVVASNNDLLKLVPACDKITKQLQELKGQKGGS